VTTTNDSQGAQQQPRSFQEAAVVAEQLLANALNLLRPAAWPDGQGPSARQLAPLGRARVAMVQALDGVREALK